MEKVDVVARIRGGVDDFKKIAGLEVASSSEGKGLRYPKATKGFLNRKKAERAAFRRGVVACES